MEFIRSQITWRFLSKQEVRKLSSPSLKNQYRKDIMSLNELCGIVDTSEVMLQLPVIEPQVTAKFPTT